MYKPCSALGVGVCCALAACILPCPLMASYPCGTAHYQMAASASQQVLHCPRSSGIVTMLTATTVHRIVSGLPSIRTVPPHERLRARCGGLQTGAMAGRKETDAVRGESTVLIRTHRQH